MEQLGSHWIDFHEIYYLSIFGNLSRKFHFNRNQTKIKGTLHEDQYTFLITCHSVLLRIKDVSGVLKL